MSVFSADHVTQIPVKIVMIAVENKVALTFNNPVSFVETKEEEIKNIFEIHFPGWMFTDDSTREAETELTRATVTIMDCHFVDIDSYEPILNTQVKGSVGQWSMVNGQGVDRKKRVFTNDVYTI